MLSEHDSFTVHQARTEQLHLVLRNHWPFPVDTSKRKRQPEAGTWRGKLQPEQFSASKVLSSSKDGFIRGSVRLLLSTVMLPVPLMSGDTSAPVKQLVQLLSLSVKTFRGGQAKTIGCYYISHCGA